MPASRADEHPAARVGLVNQLGRDQVWCLLEQSLEDFFRRIGLLDHGDGLAAVSQDVHLRHGFLPREQAGALDVQSLTS